MNPAKVDALFGKIGIGVALAVFLGVNFFWSDIISLLESMGWSDLSDSVGGKQRKLVAAVVAFAALVPVLILQVVLKRRGIQAEQQASPESVEPPSPS